MSPFSVGAACVQRVDHGEGQPLTFDQALDAVQHPLNACKRDELVEIVAYLACQVVGYQHSQNADAKLAMSQIQRIVREFEQRDAKPAKASEVAQDVVLACGCVPPCEGHHEDES